MTNYCEINGCTLIYGTLISPDEIQFVLNDDIVTKKLDFSYLIKKGSGCDAAFYDVVVVGKRKKNGSVLVYELLDSPEETGESIYRLGDHNLIKWAFVSESDFYDSIKNLDSARKTLSLLQKDRIADIDGIGKVKAINTTVDYFDHRYPHFFVCKNKLTVSGKEEFRVLFPSFQFGLFNLSQA